MRKRNTPDSSQIDVAFLPEGGQLILNAANTVAFKAIDNTGKGIFVSGVVRKSSGEFVTAFRSSYLGMGKFMVLPEENTSYFASIDQYPEMRISLPKPVSGLGITYKEQGKSLLFRMISAMKQTAVPDFYFEVSHKGAILVRKKLAATDFETTISLERDKLPIGISKVTLLDTTLTPFAERLIFIGEDYIENVRFNLNKKAFATRDSVHIDLEAVLQEYDSINSNLSVTVVNTNYLSSFDNRQTIRSYILLDSELKGAIESPDSYFRNDSTISSSEKLDLLMLVNGWRTYLWSDITKEKTPSGEDWNDAGISISGRVKRIVWNAPVQDAEIAMDYVFRNFRIAKTSTDEEGRFRFDHIYLVDTLKVMLNARTKNGTKNAEIILDPLPYREKYIIPELWRNTCSDIDLAADFMQNNSFRRTKELEYSPEKGVILLDDIDVVEKKTRAFARSFGEYPWADKTLTVTPDDYSFNYIFDYLEDKVTGFVRSNDSFTYGNKPVIFTIDGVNAEYQELITVRMKDIDLIDILYPGFRFGYRMETLGEVDMGGLVAIYMKKPFKPNIDYEFARGRMYPEISGYQTTPVFYSPKYTPQNMDSPRPDFRPTLYWNPNVSFKDGKADLSFFSCDEHTNYVIFVEGITKSGRICFGRTTFMVNKN
jgi:hypothetical protein